MSQMADVAVPRELFAANMQRSAPYLSVNYINAESEIDTIYTPAALPTAC
jgi:hypothetical protein